MSRFQGRPSQEKITGHRRRWLIEPPKNLWIVEFELRDEPVGKVCLVIDQPAPVLHQKLQLTRLLGIRPQTTAARSVLHEKFEQQRCIAWIVFGSRRDHRLS